MYRCAEGGNEQMSFGLGATKSSGNSLTKHGQGLKTWSVGQTAAAIGKTALTFDEIFDQTLRPDAESIVGINLNMANAVQTSGQNGAPLLEINSSDLGVANERFPLNHMLADGIASNDKEHPIGTHFIPMFWDRTTHPQAEFGKASVALNLSSTTTTTGGWTTAAGLVFANRPLTDFEKLAFMIGQPWGMKGGDFRTGTNTTVAATTLSSGNGAVPAFAKMLVALASRINANAPTTVEEAIGIVEYKSANIPDFSPQQYPAMGTTSSLGTPVGTAIELAAREIMAIFFPLPGIALNMDVTIAMAVVISNAAQSDGQFGYA